MSKQITVSRLLVTMLVALTTLCGFAQDSYRQALKDYLILNGQTKSLKKSLEGIKKSLEGINNYVFEKNDNLDFNQLLDRYVNECILDKMVDKFESVAREANLTESDIKGVSSLLATPQGQSYVDHSFDWGQEISANIVPLVTGYIGGGETENIQPDAAIGSEYAAKFKSFFDKSEFKTVFLSVFETGFNAFAPTKQMPESLKKWIDDNIMTVAMNSAYGILTADDLDFANGLTANATFNKLQTIATQKLKSMDLQEGKEMVADYIEWMQGQGATLSASAEMILNMLQQMK